mmetsp:Transcript_1313/g.2061  ORF Transcript_1313/g.2061 Transcript_1313/m.2061 type:complete len:84 (-) Transcript_1313:857-1108(-)
MHYLLGRSRFLCPCISAVMSVHIAQHVTQKGTSKQNKTTKQNTKTKQKACVVLKDERLDAYIVGDCNVETNFHVFVLALRCLG